MHCKVESVGTTWRRSLVGRVTGNRCLFFCRVSKTKITGISIERNHDQHCRSLKVNQKDSMKRWWLRHGFTSQWPPTRRVEETSLGPDGSQGIAFASAFKLAK